MAAPTPKVKVFVGSAYADLSYATAFKSVMQEGGGLSAVVWKDAFRGGETILAGLNRILGEYDFGVFLLRDIDLGDHADDATASVAPSANVVLEFGMFYGRLGADGVFVACPSDAPNLPSDLSGLIVRSYVPNDRNRNDAVREAAQEARQLALTRAARPPQVATAPSPRVLPEEAPDGWRTAAEEGWLEPIGEGVSPQVGDAVIDRLAGWGRVAGVRVGVRGERLAIVALPGGDEIELPATRLFRAKPK
jgi:hypothetical protein